MVEVVAEFLRFFGMARRLGFQRAAVQFLAFEPPNLLQNTLEQ